MASLFCHCGPLEAAWYSLYPLQAPLEWEEPIPWPDSKTAVPSEATGLTPTPWGQSRGGQDAGHHPISTNIPDNLWLQCLQVTNRKTEAWAEQRLWSGFQEGHVVFRDPGWWLSSDLPRGL